MMELIPTTVKIDFMGKRVVFIALSILAVALACWIWIKKGEDRWGIDFTGGYEFLVKFSHPTDSQVIRTKLEDAGVKEARVQALQGDVQEFAIRLRAKDDSQQIRGQVEAALRAGFAEGFTVAKVDYVGPTVGSELQSKALTAVIISLVGILIYIAVRFEFAVGLGSVIALAHDVVISTGVYLAVGHTISMATLAAALTIVGYSVNDTVVVFDRVREERNRRKDAKLVDLVNESLNLTLSRTVITHMLTLFSALALYLFGGGEIGDLSLYLVVGIICGSYSTVFIVSPVVIWWEQFRGRDTATTVARAARKAAV